MTRRPLDVRLSDEFHPGGNEWRMNANDGCRLAVGFETTTLA